MKTTFALGLLAGALLAGSLAFALFPRYRYLTPATSPLLYRCDRWTGKVSVVVSQFRTGEYVWRHVIEYRDIFDDLPDAPVAAP